MNRRQFVKTSAGAAALLAMRGRAQAFSVSPALQKFVSPMRRFGAPIPLAAKVTGKYSTNVDYYEITAGSFREQLHPSLPNPTRLCGYKNTAAAGYTHLGGAILGRTGTPVRIKFKNELPAKHIIPFDSTIPMPLTGLRQDRMAVHLHGGLVPWTSDGGPFHWTSNPLNNTSYPAGTPVVGPSQVMWLPDNTGNPTDDYYYPNSQSARFMWYHDHAIGTTRTSAYAGLATGYLLGDGIEDGLAVSGISVSPLDTNYLIMVFQDKVFWDPLIDPGYSTWVPGALPGDLWYPYLYEKQIWKLSGGFNAKQGGALPVPSAVAEFFGDTMLVNGLVYPYHAVSKNLLYRMRMLNACNARFLNLSFVMEDPALPGEPLLGKNGLPVAAPVNVWQIGTEGGFLGTPVQLFANGVPAFVSPLLVAPAERPDILVDFTQVPAGSKVILYNDAPAPYPAGNAMFDWFLGVKGVVAGSGPNTRTLMQLQIAGTRTAPFTLPVATISRPTLPTAADAVNGGLMMTVPNGVGGVRAAVIGDTVTVPGLGSFVYEGDQNLTLNEAFDAFGRLQQLVGTNVLNPAVPGTFGRAYLDPPTEFVKYNKIYIWNIFNLTADAHPMHFHLFNAWVLRRRPFRVNQFNGIPIYTAPGLPPDPNEVGWKETVKMYPGTCTTVAVLVEDPLPGRQVPVRDASNILVGTGTVPSSPRLTSPPYSLPATQADEYVWHCHILEHEEHDMMRPLVGGQ